MATSEEIFHVSRIMNYYEDVGGPKLADEFYAELGSFFQKAANFPEAYDIREHDLRCINLQRFPYHFFFRLVDDRDFGCSSSPDVHH